MRRKLAAIVAALLALGGFARGEALLCVRAPGVAALVDEEGAERIEAGRFDDLFAVREGELYAAGSRGAYRLYDAWGNALSDTVFAMIDDGGDALVFRQGGRYGAMDAAGKIVVPAQWTQLACGGAGGFLALEGDPYDDTPDEIIRLSPSGEATPTGVTTARGLSTVRDDRMPVVDGQGLCGAVNGEGEAVIALGWRYVGEFDGGLAKVRGDAGLGMIDAEGREVVPAVYDWLERSGAMIAGLVDGRADVYAPDGSALRYSLEGDGLELSMAGDWLAVYSAQSSRLYDAEGALVAERGAGTTFAPGAPGQAVATDGPWGEVCQWLVGADGADASGRYQQLLPLGPGRYAFLSMAGVEYYSEELGKLQKSWDYANMRYGLADDGGRALLPAVYREILPLGDDRLVLVGDGEVTLADLDGAAIRTWTTAEAEAPTAEGGA